MFVRLNKVCDLSVDQCLLGGLVLTVQDGHHARRSQFLRHTLIHLDTVGGFPHPAMLQQLNQTIALANARLTMPCIKGYHTRPLVTMQSYFVEL